MTGGSGYTVSDDEVLELQTRLALEEGIYAEPAGVVALTGALSAIRRGEVDPSSIIACLVTGSGFKDDVSTGRMTALAGPVARVATFSAFERITRETVAGRRETHSGAR
jgi:threonine synthase